MKWVIGLAVILVIAITGLWLHAVYKRNAGDVSAAAVVTAPSIPEVPVTRPLGTALPTDSAPMTLTGTALMDASAGVPAVPYITYTDEDGDFATKQLIFADARGCLPTAGDIPCVPSYPAQSAYPKLATGQHIQVSGFMRENRFLVTGITVEG